MRATRFQPSDVVISPSELEFLAEEELVTIVSSVSTTEVDDSGNSGYLSLLAGKCGKFVPNQELNVPLWLAIELRRRNQCQIKVPPWMTVPSLRDTINSERNEKTFQPLPFRYIEVSKLLLTHAKEDMGANYFKTRDLLTSLQTLRMRKIIEGIKEIQGPVTITLRDLSAFELNQVRHIFLNGMDNFHELAAAVQNAQRNPEGGAVEEGGGDESALL